MNEEDFPERFKFYDFSSYTETLPGDSFFVYDGNKNRTVCRIDCMDWGDFFLAKKNTM